MNFLLPGYTRNANEDNKSIEEELVLRSVEQIRVLMAISQIEPCLPEHSLVDANWISFAARLPRFGCILQASLVGITAFP